MKEYTLYVGLNDKDTKAQKISTIEAYKMVENTLLNNEVEGATIYEGRGIYKHENGIKVRETTLIIKIIMFDEETEDQYIDNLKRVVSILKTTLNQESIAVQVKDINSNLW